MNAVVLMLMGCAADTGGQASPSTASASLIPMNTSGNTNEPTASEPTTRQMILPLTREGAHPCEDKQRANAQAVLRWNNPVEDVALQLEIDGPGLAEERATRHLLPVWYTVLRENPVAMYCWTAAVVLPLSTPAVDPKTEAIQDFTGALHEQVSYPVFVKHTERLVLPITIQYLVEDDREILDPNVITVNVKELDPKDVRETNANLELDLALPPGDYTFRIRPAYRDGAYKYAEGTCTVSVDGYACKVKNINKK